MLLAAREITAQRSLNNTALKQNIQAIYQNIQNGASTLRKVQVHYKYIKQENLRTHCVPTLSRSTALLSVPIYGTIHFKNSPYFVFGLKLMVIPDNTVPPQVSLSILTNPLRIQQIIQVLIKNRYNFKQTYYLSFPNTVMKLQ